MPFWQLPLQQFAFSWQIALAGLHGAQTPPAAQTPLQQSVFCWQLPPPGVQTHLPALHTPLQQGIAALQLSPPSPQGPEPSGPVGGTTSGAAVLSMTLPVPSVLPPSPPKGPWPPSAWVASESLVRPPFELLELQPAATSHTAAPVASDARHALVLIAPPRHAVARPPRGAACTFLCSCRYP